MDITDTTPSRFEVGIQLFLQGHSIFYNQVAFWKDGERALHIHSHTDWNIENTTEQMAQTKINHSKIILGELAERSTEFAKVAKRLPHEHYFCYDYGTGVVALAKEVNSKFTWLDSKPA